MNRFSISIKEVNVLRVSMMRPMMMVISLACLSGLAQAKSDNDWTGFYGGLNAGVLFNAASLEASNLGFTMPDGACNRSLSFSSFFSGLQLGYTREFEGKVLLGIEADYNYNFNKQGNTACACDVNPDVSDQFTINNRQQKSLSARVGYILDNHLLPFFVAGGSLANVGITYRNEGDDYYAKNASTPGWLVGAGLEWHVTQAWSVRAEYSYTAYNAFDMRIPIIYGLYDPNGGARSNLHVNKFGVAFNYWFL